MFLSVFIYPSTAERDYDGLEHNGFLIYFPSLLVPSPHSDMTAVNLP